MLFKNTTTYNAHPRVYNNTAYLNDTQLIMRYDEMNETFDIHNYCMLYTTKNLFRTPHRIQGFSEPSCGPGGGV